MLILQRIKIHNFLSYLDLDVDLTKYSVCQLVGNNGVGKTNLLIAITEAAFGKNIRGYSKEELSNRYTDDEGYTLTLEYRVNQDQYIAHTKRTASRVTVSLKKNGKDISGHTVKDTYKAIEDSFGYSFDMFCQLVYQSSDFSMNFLEATPAVRRKFLVNFTDANTIQEDIDKASDKHKELKKELTNIQSVREILKKNNSATEKRYEELEKSLTDSEQPLTTEDECHRLIRESELAIQDLSNRISDYSTVDSQLQAAQKALAQLKPAPAPKLSEVKEKLPVPIRPDATDLTLEKDALAKLNKELAEKKTLKLKLEDTVPPDTCSACGSHLSNETAIQVHLDKVKEVSDRIVVLNDYIQEVGAKVTELDLAYRRELINFNSANEFNAEQDRLALQNTKLELEYSNSQSVYIGQKAALTEKVEELTRKFASMEKPDSTKLVEYQNTISSAKTDLAKIKADSAKFAEKAALVAKLAEEKNSMSELSKEEDKLLYRTTIASTLVNSLKEVMAKTFEDSLQLLEKLTNRYLAVFSNGDFAIKFVADSTNLNIQLFNKGIETKLHTASKGQKTRITISCLLAIRKLLTSMAKQPINLLILDEVVGVLDSDGKEQLLSILENEHELNIYLVSHEWSHPLLSKIFVSVDNKGFTRYDYE